MDTRTHSSYATDSGEAIDSTRPDRSHFKDATPLGDSIRESSHIKGYLKMPFAR